MIQNMLFYSKVLDFYLQIDNKRTIYKICTDLGYSYSFGYDISKILKLHELVTINPFQLTKKGELFRKKLGKILFLLNVNGK